MTTPPTNKEAGNVFIFILMGIVLFGALIFAFTKSGQQSLTNISKQQARLAASEILNYGRVLEGAVNKLRSNGCAESQISFDNTFVSGYSNPNAPVDGSCDIFGSNGGKVAYKVPSDIWFDSTHSALSQYGEWYFTMSTCLPRLGSSVLNCHVNPQHKRDYELFVVLKYLKMDICTEILRQLGYSTGIPADGNPMFRENSKYQGSNASDGRRIENTGTRTINCMTSNAVANDEPPGSYHFYQVLIIRG